MVADANIEQIPSKKRRLRIGGRPPPLKLEQVIQVAKDVAIGVPLRYSLAINNIPRCEDDFNVNLTRNSAFRLAYTRELGLTIKEFCQAIASGDTKEIRRFNGLAFLLERRHRDDFGRQTEPMNQTNIQINGASRDLVSGIRELAKRQIQRKSKPAQILDVQAEKVS